MEWVFVDEGIMVTRPWFEFETLVIKLFCDAIDRLDLGWKDIRRLVQRWPIWVIAIIAKTRN
jgi:hypothetical protein